MKKLIVAAVLFAAMLGGVTGCKSIKVTRHPATLATITQTNGVITAALDAKGNPIILDGGWGADYFQHANWQKFDMLSVTAGPGVALTLNGYESGVDSNLVALVDVSLRGTAELAAKIGTAIATCGGSAAAEGGASGIISLAKQAYNRFVKRGGDEAKAVVSSAADGTVTVSDGSIGVQCANGVCSDCADGACKD